MRKGSVVALAFLILVAAGEVAARGDRIAEMSVGSSSLHFTPGVEFDWARLDFVGKNVSISRTFEPGTELSLELADLQGGPLADGTYNFSLALKTSSRVEKVTDEFAGNVVNRMTGSILIRNGVAFSEEELSTAQSAAELEVVLAGLRDESAISLGLTESPGPEDQVINDDLIVEGSVCASTNSTCASGQAFGTTEFLALGVIPSIVLNEDFTSQGLWEFDTASGHLRFGDDRTGTIPMTLQQGAASNSLFVAASSNVGIGTAAPAERLHIVGEDDIRMEDGGGTIWDFGHGSGAIGDLEFQLVDDGAGNNLGSVLTLENDEDPGNFIRGVGIFEANPLARLHVASPGDDGTAKILVTETNSTVTGRTLFELQNNGNVQFFFQNTDSGDLWQMSQLSTVFQVSTPSGNGKFRVRKGGGLQALTGSTTILDLNATGDLTVKSVTQTSSRTEKRGFESVDAVSVLEKVAGLPISEWSYKADSPSVRHLGPMAEDFHAAFGLGKTDKGITSVDTSGVAFAAIQGLNQKLAEKDARISELEQRLLELEEMVQALAEH